MLTYPEYFAKIKGVDTHPQFYDLGIFDLGKDSVVQKKIGPQAANCIEEKGVKDPSGLLIDFSGVFSLDGLQELAEEIVPALEHELYGCNLYVDKVYCYRNLPCKKASASWLWHWDNNPQEIFKIIIYLTDVNDDQDAPFEYLTNPDGTVAIKQTTRIGYNHWKKAPNGSRVSPKEVSRIVKDGGKTIKVLGPKGTVIVFNNNIVHRANIPAPGRYRDVITLRVRPTLERLQPYVDTRWTTTSEVTGAVPIDPEQRRQK